MSGMHCRGLKGWRGFAAGGIVNVPGASRSGVADDIHVDDAPVGGFVLPADSVQALRQSNPELLAQILAAIQQAGGDADGAATAQIAISNGELFIPPEAVAALGGAEVLNAIKDATHQQVNAPAAKPIDAPPPPGGVNAPLDAVVQPPRGLPLGMAGAVLPDAAMPGSAQSQQQRTFFKGGGAVARGLFTGGGVVRRRYGEGDEIEEQQRRAQPPQDFNIARSPTLPQPVQQETSFAGDAPKTLWQTTAAAKPAQEFVSPDEATAQQSGVELDAATRKAGETAAETNRVAREFRANRQTFSSYAAARAPETPTTTPASAATQQQPTTPANTATPAAAQQGGWKPTGIAGVMRRGNEYSNVPEIGADGKPTGGYVSAFAPAEIRQGAAAAAPAGYPAPAGGASTTARIAGTDINPNNVSDATRGALLAAQKAALARGESIDLTPQPRGFALSTPSSVASNWDRTAQDAIDANNSFVNWARRRGIRSKAMLEAVNRVPKINAEIAARWRQMDDAAAQQQAANSLAAMNAANERQRAASAALAAAAQQPRGMSSASGQGAQQRLTEGDIKAGLMQQMLAGGEAGERAAAQFRYLFGKGDGGQAALEKWVEGKTEDAKPYHWRQDDPQYQIHGGQLYYRGQPVQKKEKA